MHLLGRLASIAVPKHVRDVAHVVTDMLAMGCLSCTNSRGICLLWNVTGVHGHNHAELLLTNQTNEMRGHACAVCHAIASLLPMIVLRCSTQHVQIRMIVNASMQLVVKCGSSYM